MEENKIKQSVLITGGTSGIGLGICLGFLQEGYRVIINYCNDSKRAKNVAAELLELGYRELEDYIFLAADIGDDKQLHKLLDSLSAEVKESLTCLINNAGVLKRGSFQDLSQSDWESVFKVNVFGIINCTKWFAQNVPYLQSIVNIGSVRGEPHIARTDNLIYSISKSTVPTLTAALAKALGPKIRVNAIIPGTIDTPQRQGISQAENTIYGEQNAIVKRLGKPQEVADLCLYLCSEKASYITGASFTIDGGYSINYIH